MFTSILFILVLAAAAPWFQRVAKGATGWILALAPFGVCVYLASHVPGVAEGRTVTSSWAWIPTLDVNLSFFLDGLSLLFAIIVSGIGALVLVFSGGYLAGRRGLGRFYAFLLLFMASMLGLVLADNVITLFVFWELTSVSSYLLIGFDCEREPARKAALQALLVTGLGGLALLAGLLMLGNSGGSLELSALRNTGDVVRASPLYLPILLLVLAGAFTKSAQFPFHFWLPSAMEAPTPASAYLHSSTMVKAGVYLLARLHPVLGGTDEWFTLLTGFGGITMLAGAYFAVQQTYFKRLLAYTTVSALGMMVFLLGIGTEGAIAALVTFLLAHALYKGALFMVAGAVDHETGERNVEKLGGLRRAMPVTAAAAGLAALSMAGVPLFFGFIAKELVYGASLRSHSVALGLTLSAVAANVLLVAAAAAVGLKPFFGELKETPKHPHEAPLSLWLGPATLAVFGLLFGLFPGLCESTLVSPAAASCLGSPTEVHLALWHGFTLAFVLTLVTIGLGILVYVKRARLRAWSSRLDAWYQKGPSQGYQLSLKGLNALAGWQTRVLQSGYLRFYLLVIISSTVGLVGWTFAARGEFYGFAGLGDIRFHEAALVLLILAATGFTVHARSRMAAVASLGVVGYCVSLVFVLYGAPDLAMTQLVIESLTVLLFVLVFYHLPPYPRVSSPSARVRDFVVAGLAGALITALILVATNVQFQPSIASYFAANSLPGGHGRNIVNVILVDFRGLDTLGEITVLSLAGVGVYALLKLRPGKERQR